MITRRALAGTLIIGALSSAAVAEPVEVSMGSDPVGRGYLFRERETCWAITPTHVVANRGKLSEFAVRRLDGRSGIALRPVDLQDDLTLAAVQGLDQAHCTLPLPGWNDLSSVIDSVSQARIDTIEGATTVRRAATIAALDGAAGIRIAVKPLNPRDAIYQGMSGSVVYANLGAEVGDRPIGMLIGVAPDGVSGIALRWDFIVRRIDALLRKPPASASAPAGTAAVNLGSEARGARVTRWSVPPATPAEGPQNLLRPDGIWRTVKPATSVELDVMLPSRVQRIHALSLTVPPSPSAGLGPDRVAITFLVVREDGSVGEISGPVCTINAAGTSPCPFAEAEVAGVRLAFFRADQRPFTLTLSNLTIN